MHVYVILTKDRQGDPDIEVYQQRERAINRAKQQAKDWGSNSGHYEEFLYTGILFGAEYTPEHDEIIVMSKEVAL